MPRNEVKPPYNILVFEYITGGGFAQQALPESLAKEGAIVLNALVNELSLCADIKLTVVVDWRIDSLKLPKNTTIVKVVRDQCIYQLLPGLMDKADFIWPVAPEIEDALYKITQLIERNNIRLLNSSSQAVFLCSDKLATAQWLNKYDITTVEGIQLDLFSNQFAAPWVIKPKDGAGCLNSYYIADSADLNQITKLIECPLDYLIQPYLKGESLSLSCLFNEGKAWLLCCNQQLITIKQGKFELEACIVNIASTNLSLYQILINRIAKAIPGLTAYVGIDIIHPENSVPSVLEINPRLTTSYVGINKATGFNVANAVIEMSGIVPIIVKTSNKPFKVVINE